MPNETDCSECQFWNVSTDNYPCKERKTMNCPFWEEREYNNG